MGVSCGDCGGENHMEHLCERLSPIPECEYCRGALGASVAAFTMDTGHLHLRFCTDECSYSWRRLCAAACMANMTYEQRAAAMEYAMRMEAASA